MKILIINPPYYRLQGQSLVHYPAGCCYMAAALEKAGFKTVIYNADWDKEQKTILGNTNHLNLKKQLKTKNNSVWHEIKSYLVKSSPDILIISVFGTTLEAGNKIAQFAKTKNPKVITIFEGCFNRGLHTSINPGKQGDFSVMDFAIRGEAEETIVELVRAIEKGINDFSKIKGLSWNKNKKQFHNPDRPWNKSLDTLPFPARHLVDGYEKMPPHAFQAIYGSRGCPYNCTFCASHIGMGYKPRLRSAQNLVSEIEDVYQKFKTRYFYLCDDIFFIDKFRAREFCQLLIKKKLPIYFSVQTRAELVDLETLKLVKKAGGQHIAVGVEVGDERVRKLIKKGNSVDDVKRCARLIKEAGLRLAAFCMIGLPWEEKKEIEATVNLIKEIKPYIIYPYVPHPSVGTELFNQVKKADSDKMKIKEQELAISWAMKELEKINKKSLIGDILLRPGFYLALASDMNFFKHPKYLLGYLKDYLHV